MRARPIIKRKDVKFFAFKHSKGLWRIKNSKVEFCGVNGWRPSICDSRDLINSPSFFVPSVSYILVNFPNAL